MSGEIYLPINSQDPNAPSEGRLVVYAKNDGLYLRRSADTIGIRLRLGLDDTNASALLNNDASDMAYGEVVIWDTTANAAVIKTSVAGDYRVAGVVNSDVIEPGNVGSVMTLAGQIVDVLCDTSAVARGQFLAASSVPGRARALGYYRTENTFGVALSEKAAGSEGLVTAMLMHSMRTALAGGAGWAVGGMTTSSVYTTNTQRLTFVNETWGSVASAALPSSLGQQAGLANGITCGYSIGGFTGSANVVYAYKITFATDTLGAVTGADLATGRRGLRYGHHTTDKGWAVAGFTSSNVSTVDKVTYSTDMRTSGGSLTVSESYRVGVSDGAQTYTVGTVLPTNRIVAATEIITEATDANLTTSANWSSAAFPIGAGYFVQGNAAGKIVFATGVSASLTGPSAAHSQASGVGDGLAVGYFGGHSASPYNVTERFNPATETFSSAGMMEIGKFLSAVLNNGAY